MNGAQTLAQTLVNCGVEVCFANPGTSEMQFVAALDQVPALRAVLCLFEGVATGAADGYGRVSGKPAATLLHLGPGLANGIANLHNARRAATPIVNVVGDHATYHLRHDAPLTADIAGLAATASRWVHACADARETAVDAARAVQAARQAPGGIATLILPADAAWTEAGRPAGPLPVNGPAVVAADTVEAAARLLSNGKASALLLRGAVLSGAGREAAGRVQAACGARLLCDTFAPHGEDGAGRVAVERIPYFAEQMVECLRGLQQIVLVGSRPPVSFFAYPDKPGLGAPADCAFVTLAHAHEDGPRALADLADALGAPVQAVARRPLILADPPRGRLTAETVAMLIARLTPDHALHAEEALTSSRALLACLTTARPHVHMPVTGGSIGQGLPLAVGAALAAPDAKVVCAHGDGGAAYTLQALWTMARENLDVTVVIYANRSYAILNIELQRVGAGAAGARARSLLDLGNPPLDWVKIAGGMGVEAVRTDSCEDFAKAYEAAMRHRGPRLIEAVI